MNEWTLGITDSRPSSWRSCQPHWDDEKIVASSSHTFYDVMNKLCNSAIKNRREYDHGINEHLWNMKIMSMDEAMNPPSPDERLMRMLEHDDDSDGSDDSMDDNEEKYRGNVTIQCPAEAERGGYEDFDDPDAQIMNSDIKLNSGVLPEGYILAVTYDYGTTTLLYLKVLKIRSTAVQSLLEYFSMEANTAQMVADLKAVPAYNLPLEQQIDCHFPYASKAFLGYYLPLFKSKTSKDIGVERRVMGSITLGLLSKITTEVDTVFCTMEDRNSTQDLLFCPGVLDLNELMEVVNKAWEPRDRKNDPDGLEQFRYDWISRWVVGANDDAEYKRIKESIEDDTGFGAKRLLFRLDKDGKSTSSFEFEKLFPKTFAMMKSGKFRWFRYKKGVLRVIVGRGKGEGSRECEPKQVLRTWKYDFKSFHEMLCAVEASWVWKGRELTAEDVLPEHDSDLGPSMPLPKEPTCYGKEEDAVVISKCAVTALAISEEEGGKTVLYSGHDDGTLSKWSLDTNEQIWSKSIYPDGTKDYERYTACGLYVKETPGVAGIAVRSDPLKKGRPIVFTWTDAYNGYPSADFKDRGASVLKAWSGVDGKFICEYVCDIGNEQEDGSPARPSISAVVFCKVFYDRLGCVQDTILVGLHCCCNALKYDEKYSDFDIEEAREFSEGNIIPFLENSHGRSMDSWRGHSGMIRAMAVVREEYVVSVSITSGCGYPDQMILWSLDEAGVPLFRKDFYDHYQSNLFKRKLSRLNDVDGIGIEGNELLISDKHGDRIVSATLYDEGDDGPIIEINGFAGLGTKYYEDEGFHGRMAVSEKYVSVAMEIDPTAWIFRITGNSSHKNLDRRDGNDRNFRADYDRSDDSMEALRKKRAGREMAAGKVKFPLFGGNNPPRKKRKPGAFGMIDFGSDEKDGFGRGGPITLAMRGRHIIGGFSNGSLVKFLLPDTFAETKPSLNANDRSSCGSLPSDEWHVPILDCEDD
ncbi:hypothetical protein ACHAWT_004441 [Skeletonema menzelii]